METLWQKVLICLLCLESLAWAQASGADRAPVVGAPVWTSSGLIQGHAAPNRSAVSEYLGIPYGQAPIGDLRFAAPVAFQSNNTYNASSFSPDCPANIGKTPNYPGFTPQAPYIVKAFAQQLGTPQSEDCLHLNVWSRPATQLKPVLLFIHGGRFSVGGSHSPFYDGEILVDENDVVVVTINYRLMIFGFSGIPGYTQNVALLDQRLAVEWVHRNIQAFGGDPNRITIFGQSAGGASVDYYSYAWVKNPIVNGFISHSGDALSFAPNTPEQSASYFFNVSSTLGCGDATSHDVDAVVSCVRNQTFQSVLAAVAKVPFAPSPAIPQPVFHPTVDNITVFGDYLARSAAGNFAKLPYILNNNDNEAGYYRINAFAAGINLTDFQWTEFNDAAFTCPTGAEAANRAALGIPTWRSRYFGDWPNLRLYPTSGAYHGVDLHMVFGTAQAVSGLPNTDAESTFHRYMSSAWVAFAADPAHGLSRAPFNWPTYQPSGNTLIRLAFNNQTTASFVEGTTYDQLCPGFAGNTTLGKGAF